MDNLFDPEHLLYGLAGAAVIGLLGYYIGLAVFAMSASAASYNTNVTAANFFIARFSPLPMIGTIIGSAIGLFGGIIYSRERQRSLHGQLPVVVLPQASGTQTPIILVHQPQQHPQVPQILILPQEREERASQLPIIMLPQASGTQTPIVLVHQPSQTPQVPQILILPQAGQQPILVTPQQAQQQK